MSSKKEHDPIIFEIKLYYQISKRLLHFHITILNLNCSQKETGINFYCRAPFQPKDYPSDKCSVKKAVDYDVPHASSINDDRVYPCCGFLELEKWNVCHHRCVDDIRPYRQQLLESETAFCNICRKNCFSSRFCFTPRTCTFMFTAVCLSCLSFYLYYLFLFLYAYY